MDVWFGVFEEAPGNAKGQEVGSGNRIPKELKPRAKET